MCFIHLAELENGLIWVLVPGRGYRNSCHGHMVLEKLPRPISGLLLNETEPVCIFTEQNHSSSWSYLALPGLGDLLCVNLVNSPGVRQLRLKGHQKPFISIGRIALLKQP